MNEQDDFGPAPEWLALQPDREATELERCQQLVANLRAAMMAATAILHREETHTLADLLWDAADGLSPRAHAARRALEEDAGYIADTQGECYP